jgi:hypothetical protein
VTSCRATTLATDNGITLVAQNTALRSILALLIAAEASFRHFFSPMLNFRSSFIDSDLSRVARWRTASPSHLRDLR